MICLICFSGLANKKDLTLHLLSMHYDTDLSKIGLARYILEQMKRPTEKELRYLNASRFPHLSVVKDLQPLYFTLANGDVSFRKDHLTEFQSIMQDCSLSKNLFRQFWCSPVEFNIPDRDFTMVRLDKMYCVMFTNELITCRVGRFDSFVQSIS